MQSRSDIFRLSLPGRNRTYLLSQQRTLDVVPGTYPKVGPEKAEVAIDVGDEIFSYMVVSNKLGDKKKILLFFVSYCEHQTLSFPSWMCL